MLDEPMSGLDPAGVEGQICRSSPTEAAAGRSVLFSSHQLDLVEHVCESVAIIDRGRLVVEGAVPALERGERPRLAVRVAGDASGGLGRRGLGSGAWPRWYR